MARRVLYSGQRFLMIAAVISGARNAGRNSTPPSFSSRLPRGQPFAFV
jgi:hypothetical protein